MSTLKLQYCPEDEWHGELAATIHSEEFCGRGAAWFSISQLQEFCEKMERFPIRAGDRPELRGGFWNTSGETLDQCHLGVTVVAHGNLGRLRVSVELATPVWKDPKQELHNKLFAEFLVSYSELESFRQSVMRVLDGQQQEALLQARPS